MSLLTDQFDVFEQLPYHPFAFAVRRGRMTPELRECIRPYTKALAQYASFADDRVDGSTGVAEPMPLLNAGRAQARRKVRAEL